MTIYTYHYNTAGLVSRSSAYHLHYYRIGVWQPGYWYGSPPVYYPGYYLYTGWYEQTVTTVGRYGTTVLPNDTQYIYVDPLSIVQDPSTPATEFAVAESQFLNVAGHYSEALYVDFIPATVQERLVTLDGSPWSLTDVEFSASVGVRYPSGVVYGAIRGVPRSYVFLHSLPTSGAPFPGGNYVGVLLRDSSINSELSDKTLLGVNTVYGPPPTYTITYTYVITTNTDTIVVRSYLPDGSEYVGPVSGSLVLRAWTWQETLSWTHTITSLPETITAVPSTVLYLEAYEELEGPSIELIPHQEPGSLTYGGVEYPGELCPPIYVAPHGAGDMHFHWIEGMTLDLVATLDGVSYEGPLTFNAFIGHAQTPSNPITFTSVPQHFVGLYPGGYLKIVHSGTQSIEIVLDHAYLMGASLMGVNNHDWYEQAIYGGHVVLSMDFASEAEELYVISYVDGVATAVPTVVCTITGGFDLNHPANDIQVTGLPYATRKYIPPGLYCVDFRQWSDSIPANLWVYKADIVRVMPGDARKVLNVYFRTIPQEVDKGRLYHVVAWDRVVSERVDHSYECGLLQMHDDPWGNYVLECNIDASPSAAYHEANWEQYYGWMPLGLAALSGGITVVAGYCADTGRSTIGEPFHGWFDGAGYSISNLHMLAEDEAFTYTGPGSSMPLGWPAYSPVGHIYYTWGIAFFGLVGVNTQRDAAVASRSVVKNLKLVDAELAVDNQAGQGWSLLVGTTLNEADHTFDISKCEVSGAIRLNGDLVCMGEVDMVGGILGGTWSWSRQEISCCKVHTLSILTTMDDHYGIGGLVGGAGAGSIHDCILEHVTIDVGTVARASYDTYGVGGCIGFAEVDYQLKIDRCVIDQVHITTYASDCYSFGGFIGWGAWDNAVVVT
jgi:hypothetical protein